LNRSITVGEQVIVVARKIVFANVMIVIKDQNLMKKRRWMM
jgi:hypothetical protein